MNKEMKKELTRISAEIEAEAIQMRLDYERNPSDMPSGSVIEVPSDNSSYSIWCMDMSTTLCQTA